MHFAEYTGPTEHGLVQGYTYRVTGAFHQDGETSAIVESLGGGFRASVKRADLREVPEPTNPTSKEGKRLWAHIFGELVLENRLYSDAVNRADAALEVFEQRFKGA